MKQLVAWLFGAGMVANALLFIPQALAIWRKKTAEGVSVLTFAGFNAMQLIAVLHSYFQGDWYLGVGMAVSFITCGSVTVLAMIYGGKKPVGA
jgi:MtN3 and saliva related transmembrane protein